MTPINTDYRWRPIEDYEQDPASLAKSELRTLADVWQEQRQSLESHQGLRTFNERLRREWAIETGLLERIYLLDRGVTELLIDRGLDASLIPHDVAGQDPQQVVAVLRDHEAAIDVLFDFVKGNRPLSTGFIKELHALLTRNQRSVHAVDSLGRRVEVSMEHGTYKKLPNNPSRPDGVTHEYCPPEHVDAEMDALIAMHLRHVDVAPEVEAAWLHHRFTQIHPFQDGNGRVARALATLVLIKAGWFPLVVRDTRDERARYLDALEQADHGDLSDLVGVFAAAQRKAFVQALGISGQVIRSKRAEQVVAATREQLHAREAARRQEWEGVKDTARELERIALDRFKAIATTLSAQTSQYLEQPTFFANAATHGEDRARIWFRWQVVQTAKALGYFANLSEYHAWVRLVLDTGNRAEILVSVHGIGPEFRGVLGVSACFFRREQTEQGDREVANVVPLARELFQVNYKETVDQVAGRFRDWLEDCLVNGLETWRQGL
jgi:Fic family protein